MLYSGTDPESYITEYTLVYEDIIFVVAKRWQNCCIKGGPCAQTLYSVPRKVDVRLPEKSIQTPMTRGRST